MMINSEYFFEIEIPVRITDINYGGHLGHAELVKLTHQARLKFLLMHNLSENNIDEAGVIVKALAVKYLGESFFDDLLQIKMKIKQKDKIQCTIIYDIHNKSSNKPAAQVEETLLFMNYNTRKVVRVPNIIHEILDK